MSYFLMAMLSLGAVVANAIIIKQTAFKNNKLTCNDYILNTYLYVLLGFLIISTIILATFENSKMQNVLKTIFGSIFSIILFLIVYVGIIIWFYMIDPKDNLLLLHIVWLLCILMFSILLYIPVQFAYLQNILKPAILVTLLITVTVVYLGIKYGDKIITFDWDKYLRIALIMLIGVYISLMFYPPNQIQTTLYILSAVSLVIFTLLLLSYNKKLTERAKECHKDNNPNYPKESMGLIIKVMNIFMDILKLMSRKRR
jgi:hypothetical protein